MQETWVQSLSQEDPLEKKMVTHSSIPAWEILWTEEPGGYNTWGRKEWDTAYQLNNNKMVTLCSQILSGDTKWRKVSTLWHIEHEIFIIVLCTQKTIKYMTENAIEILSLLYVYREIQQLLHYISVNSEII